MLDLRLRLRALLTLFGIACASPCLADDGKLLATGGVSQVEGAGGGGLVPWALITGYETRDGIGVTVHETYVPLHDFTLHSPGIAIGLYDRVELSYAADLFGIDNQNLSPGGLMRGRNLRQDVFGAKARLYGDAVYDQDSWIPQIAVGTQYKRSNDKDVLQAVGAKESSGADFYLSGTKILLNYSLLVNATVRLTRANQFGLLGFGGPNNNSYQPEFEGSVAYLLSKRLAVGAEYRMKPNNLTKFAGALPISADGDAYDVFVAYFLTKNVSLTAAYVDLGKIADVSLAPLGIDKSLEPHNQNGGYVSVQFAF